MAASQKAPSKGRKASKARTKPRAKSKKSTFTPMQYDIIGLVSLAISVFLIFTLYFDRAGGKLGEAVRDGLQIVFGEVSYTVPIILLIAGCLLIMRPQLPKRVTLWVGLPLCLFGTELALAAETFGLGGAPARTELWQSAFYKTHGGLLGEALFAGARDLLQTTGADILAVLLFLLGLLMVSGTTVGALAMRLRSGANATGQLITTSSSGITKLLKSVDNSAHSRSSKAKPLEDPLLDPSFQASEPTVAVTKSGPDQFDTELFDLDHLNLEQDDQTPEMIDAGFIDAAEDEAEEDLVEEFEFDQQVEFTEDDLTPQGRFRSEILDDPNFVWRLPDSKLLKQSSSSGVGADRNEQQRIAKALIETLGHFGIQSKVVGVVSGPHISRYEIQLAPGIKVSKVTQLKDDLAYALAATDIRILAPIPGKQAVGVEVPNSNRLMVHLGDVYEQSPKGFSPLTVALGKDVSGKSVLADLAKMPHLLVAGTTGAGKSGCINAMLTSVLLSATPKEVRMVLVDPKQVELNHYEAVPHLLTPVITNPRKAANALQNLVREMEERYSMMSLARARKLPELNVERERHGKQPLPYILCVIDELADLMMVAPADVEDSIIRLAQKARAVGIHLVLATQSPRVDVITGMIKANVPSRIAFAVSSQTDSRVILDQNGAETLLGQGDMLFAPIGSSKLQRIQGAYVDEQQIAKITEFWSKQGEPNFKEELLEEVSEVASEGGEDKLDPNEDPLLAEAIRMVAEMQTASTSMLQRRLRVGYTRAGRLIDMLERRGVISGYEGSKPRQVLISEAGLPEFLAKLNIDSQAVDEEQTAVEDQPALTNEF